MCDKDLNQGVFNCLNSHWLGRRHCLFVFNVPPIAKLGHMETGPLWLKVSSDRWEKPGIEQANPCLQGKYIFEQQNKIADLCKQADYI